jgi:outer membrane protein
MICRPSARMLYFCFMRYTVLTILAALSIFMPCSAQEKWDLKKCVDYAWQNNISVKQQEIQAKLAGINENQAKLSAYPNANFSTNTGVQFGRSVDPTTNQFTTTQLLFQGANLNADIVVFNWHRTKNTLLSSQLETKASVANVEKVKNDIALLVATNFLQALLNKEQVGIAEVQFMQTKNQLEATRRRVKAGALPELNATELEAQLARDSTGIINAKATADISMLQLKALLNVDAASAFDIEVPPVDKIPVDLIADLQPAAVYALALQNQPAQKVNQLRLQSLLANVKASKASLYPTISAFVGLGTNFANPFKKVTGFNFIGYENPDPRSGAVTVDGTQYFLQQPKFTVTQANKSFGELWKGYGTQVNQNFRQNLGFAINVPIFNGGTAKSAYERSKLNVKNQELTIQQANFQLKQDIYQAYTNAVSAMERYNSTAVSMQASTKTFEFAKKRYYVGLLGTFELITNQNNLTRAMLDNILAKYEYVFRMKVLEFYKGQGLKL